MSRPNSSSVKSFREVVRALVPDDAKYVVQVWYFPDPEDGPGGEGSVKAHKLKKNGLVKTAVAGYKEDGNQSDPLPTSLNDVLEWVNSHFEGDGSWCNVRILTLKDYRKKEEERERKACESLAAEIMARYGVKLNSLAFIAAVHRHYGRIAEAERHFREDGESKMERWGRASMNGNTEGYWSDQDYSSTLEHRARDSQERLMNYLNKYCPLLMARWQERQERRKKK